jgi:hypothetical protein
MQAGLHPVSLFSSDTSFRHRLERNDMKAIGTSGTASDAHGSSKRGLSVTKMSLDSAKTALAACCVVYFGRRRADTFLPLNRRVPSPLTYISGDVGKY